MPHYFPFDPDPRTPRKAPHRIAAIASFMSSAAQINTRCGLAQLTKCLRLLSPRRSECTESSGSNAGSSCSRRRTAPIIRQCSTLWRDAGPELPRFALTPSCFPSATTLTSGSLTRRGFVAPASRGRGSVSGFTPDGFDRVLARVRELGWYAKVQPEVSGIAGNAGMFDKMRDLPVLIDHMSRPDLGAGKKRPKPALAARVAQARQFLGDAFPQLRRYQGRTALG